MTNRRATSHESTIGAVLRELWSIGPGDLFSTSARAMQATNNLESPTLSIFGVSTIREFYQSLSGSAVENGLMNRFTMIRAEARSEERDPDADPFVVPQEIASRIAELLPPATLGNLSGIQLLVGYKAPAEILRIPFASERVRDLYMAFSNRLLSWGDEDGSVEPFIGRTAEMAIRLATIHAVGVAGRRAVIDENEFRWGATIALHSAGFMISDAAANMAENEHQANYKLVLDHIRKARRMTRTELYRGLEGRVESWQLNGLSRVWKRQTGPSSKKNLPGRRAVAQRSPTSMAEPGMHSDRAKHPRFANLLDSQTKCDTGYVRVAMGTRYNHLTLEERCRLRGMMEMGLSMSEMARRAALRLLGIANALARASSLPSHARRLRRRPQCILPGIKQATE